MKKFLAWIGGIVLFGAITTGVTLCVMAKVHDNSIKNEWKSWTKQAETVVVETPVEEPEDETQEELPGEETPEPNEGPTSGDEGTSTEDETQTET